MILEQLVVLALIELLFGQNPSRWKAKAKPNKHQLLAIKILILCTICHHLGPLGTNGSSRRSTDPIAVAIAIAIAIAIPFKALGLSDYVDGQAEAAYLQALPRPSPHRSSVPSSLSIIRSIQFAYSVVQWSAHHTGAAAQAIQSRGTASISATEHVQENGIFSRRPIQVVGHLQAAELCRWQHRTHELHEQLQFMHLKKKKKGEEIINDFFFTSSLKLRHNKVKATLRMSDQLKKKLCFERFWLFLKKLMKYFSRNECNLK